VACLSRSILNDAGQIGAVGCCKELAGFAYSTGVTFGVASRTNCGRITPTTTGDDPGSGNAMNVN